MALCAMAVRQRLPCASLPSSVHTFPETLQAQNFAHYSSRTGSGIWVGRWVWDWINLWHGFGLEEGRGTATASLPACLCLSTLVP